MKLLVSACLLGVACRYDGASKGLPDSVLRELMARHTLVPACPEQLGGLPTPRDASERQGSPRRYAFRPGRYGRLCARRAAGARPCAALGCTAALLKQRSPSCGHGEIYDGTFTGTRVAGDGVTAALLGAHGIRVYGEDDIAELLNE